MHFDNVFGLSENTKCLNVSFALQIVEFAVSAPSNVVAMREVRELTQSEQLVTW